jgi:hypothetical protein
VAPVLHAAVRLKRDYDDLSSRLAPVPQSQPASVSGEAPPPGPDDKERADLEEQWRQTRDLIKQHLELITGLGIQIKDLDTGLIDFPTMYQGEEVLLCWRLGEPAIGYWHTYQDGFLGRRPVSILEQE